MWWNGRHDFWCSMLRERILWTRDLVSSFNNRLLYNWDRHKREREKGKDFLRFFSNFYAFDLQNSCGRESHSDILIIFIIKTLNESYWHHSWCALGDKSKLHFLWIEGGYEVLSDQIIFFFSEFFCILKSEISKRYRINSQNLFIEIFQF